MKKLMFTALTVLFAGGLAFAQSNPKPDSKAPVKNGSKSTTTATTTSSTSPVTTTTSSKTVTGTNTGAKGSRPKSVVKKTNLKSPNGSMPTSKTGAVH